MKKQILLFLSFITFGVSLVMAQVDSTQYLFNQFETAVIRFKDRTQSTEKVNYNLIIERFFFLDRVDKSIKQVSNTQDIVFIKVGNRSFILEKEACIEVLPTNPIVYVQYKTHSRIQGGKGAYGTTSETTNIKTLSSMYENGRRVDFDSTQITAGARYNIYWVEVKGKKRKFTNFKQFLKIYSNNKDLLEQHIKDNRIQFNNVEQIKNLCIYASNL